MVMCPKLVETFQSGRPTDQCRHLQKVAKQLNIIHQLTGAQVHVSLIMLSTKCISANLFLSKMHTATQMIWCYILMSFMSSAVFLLTCQTLQACFYVLMSFITPQFHLYSRRVVSRKFLPSDLQLDSGFFAFNLTFQKISQHIHMQPFAA